MKTFIKYFTATLCFFIAMQPVFCQKIETISSGTKTSLRGLSVVNNNIIWASGSNGMVAKSTNGGSTWQWMQIPNFEKKDFRDIEAFDSNTAIVMCIAQPAYILKTIDGGKNWNTVFTDTTKGMFLDAMYFVNNNNGIVIGDPINNKTFIATTTNNGNSWHKMDSTPTLANEEAFFASSGSNIFINKQDIYFVSGGKKSNLYCNNKLFEMPITKGFESTGANSIAINNNNAIIVGGDFTKDSITTNNCVLFNTKKKQLTTPTTAPNGYRSCVAFINKNTAITCGINGVDISYDKGVNWRSISLQGFHIVAKAKKGNAVFFAGSKGRIGKLVL
jgi:hypothetical protein